MLEIILSHESALAHWNNPNVLPFSAARLHEMNSELLQNTPGRISCKDIDKLTSSFSLGYLPPPLHILVSDKSKRRVLKGVRFHCESQHLPDGSFLPICDHQVYRNEALYNLLCTSPELLFVQMAPRLCFLDLVELGFEMCGEYALCGPKRCRVDRPAITHSSKILGYLDTLPPIRGSKQARRAAKYILDNSWSPKETQIVIILTLPRSMGGFGIEKPLLNHELRVGPEIKAVLKGERLIPDMYWPAAQLVLEYDSDECHDSPHAIEHDARKRSAYELMDMRVISITYDQLRDFTSFFSLAEHIASELAEHGGTRREATTSAQRNKQLRVHNWLMYGEREARP